MCFLTNLCCSKKGFIWLSFRCWVQTSYVGYAPHQDTLVLVSAFAQPSIVLLVHLSPNEGLVSIFMWGIAVVISVWVAKEQIFVITSGCTVPSVLNFYCTGFHYGSLAREGNTFCFFICCRMFRPLRNCLLQANFPGNYVRGNNSKSTDEAVRRMLYRWVFRFFIFFFLLKFWHFCT